MGTDHWASPAVREDEYLPPRPRWMDITHHPDHGWDREQRWLKIQITLICPMDPFINTLKRWNARTWLSTFPRNFHRNQNTLKHPHSGMAWEMSKALNWVLKWWSTWQKQDMNLNSNNFGLSPMSRWIYICIHILYISLSLEMQLYSWFFKKLIEK